MSEKGAFIPPSDVYCDPDMSDMDDDWEVRPTDELHEHGMRPCPICYEVAQ